LEHKRGQLIRQVLQSHLGREISAFLIDRQARGLRERTVEFYADELRYWYEWVTEQGAETLDSITPDLLRRWLLHLGETRNPGGVHASFRTLRAFFSWAWQENGLSTPNPMRRVKSPKTSQDPLEPLSLDDLRAMLDTCARKTFTGDRDRALMLCLLDTGCRVSEFIALKVADVDMGSGLVMVREGKGGKPRTTFLGSKSRRALMQYLRQREQPPAGDSLWITVAGQRLACGGLRRILTRHARQANVPEPAPHSFRRAFALMSLRNGANIYALQRLMGHSDLTVLRRYLKQTDIDLQEAHRKAGPVDNLL
jgi:integrase/recombinase XerD